ncbi:MAG: MBL fold metallo-hydrolase, partial [Chloroflexi bacterium]|nr:MBL fold metallo-hydrolase [Chloroflexota bacterium]
MKVTFWGVRGSIASPGRATAEYGGNTSCVEIRAGGELLIMDSGTGVRELGRHLLAAGEPIKGTMLLSHSHWDHIQGFPFFGPLLVPGNSFTILGPQEHSERLNTTLAGQMQYRYFPIGLDQMASEIRMQELREEEFQIGNCRISSHYLNHTSMALAYRVEAGGRTVVYATDNEPFSQQPRAWTSSESRKFLHKRDAELAEFFRGADVLIIDSQYTSHEYPGRIGWGHATPDYSLDLAISAGVGTLVMFHHDPTRIDTAVTVVEQLAQKRVAAEGVDMEVICAAEGLSLSLPDVHTDDQHAPERHL